MNKLLTIVGAGQMGGMLAHNLLKKGRSVRVIDSGNKFSRENNQTPWGWIRKFSLQSKLKKNLMVNKFPISDIKVNQTYGPMLITSTKNKSIYAWDNWILNNPETDSSILTPLEAYRIFDINKDYFEGQGAFMCVIP